MCSYHQTMVEVIKEQNENMSHIFIYDSIILHRLENRTKPILTPHDGQCWWDLNLHISAGQSPVLPLAMGPYLCNKSHGYESFKRKYVHFPYLYEP